MTTCHTLLLGLAVAWRYIFQVQIIIVWARYKLLYIYINTIYVNKNQHCRPWCCCLKLSFIIHKCGVSPLHGHIVASLKTNRICIKIVKLKQNQIYTEAIPQDKLPSFWTLSIYKNGLFLVNVIPSILIYFAWAIMGYRAQYFTYLWRRSCISLRIHHGGSCKKSSNRSDKIKMPKSTTGCRIKIFILWKYEFWETQRYLK